MAGHTKGSWHWVDPETDFPWDGVEYLCDASLRTVDEFGEDKTEEREGKRYTSFRLPKFILRAEDVGGDDESRANARLIAAAPDLLEALVLAEADIAAWEDDFSNLSKPSNVLAVVRAAISKATQP